MMKSSLFKGKNVCIVGLGKSGVASSVALVAEGARVFLTEKRPRREVSEWLSRLPKNVTVETGGHRFLQRDWDMVILSPGVPRVLAASFERKGTPVWGEMELGYRILTRKNRWPERVAGVTGTNGKTTTTALLGHIFKTAGAPTVVAGNIGAPLCGLLSRIRRDTALVLEISSYQLETVDDFRVDVGIVMNVTPDHLGRHKTMRGYAEAKGRLFRHQDARSGAVLNYEDRWCRWIGKNHPRPLWFSSRRSLRNGFYFSGERIVSSWGGSRKTWPRPPYLPGLHNVENTLAAVACARFLGVPAPSIGKAIRSFRGVEHRLEDVRTLGGVRYINDSKATNVDSTLVALKSMTRPVHLILGGEDKGFPYTPLRPWLKKRAVQVFLIGDASRKIGRDLKGSVPIIPCETLERAVHRAREQARPGEVVLLSPACASFDQFKNFEHRGHRFKELVNAL